MADSVIMSANASKDSVDQADMGSFRWYKRARLGKQDYQSRLSKVRALASPAAQVLSSESYNKYV